MLSFLNLGGKCEAVPGISSFGDGSHQEENFHSPYRGLSPKDALFCVNRGTFFPFSLKSSFFSLEVKLGEPHLSSPAWKDMNCL